MNDTLIIMKGMLSDQRSESYEKFKSLLSSIDSSYNDALLIEDHQDNYV